MFGILEELAATTGIAVEVLMLAGLGTGVLVGVLGIGGLFAIDGTTSRRMRGGKFRPSRGVDSVIRLQDNDPTGILRALVPKAGKERSKVAKNLRRAGIHSRNAVANYYIIRSVLALALPSLFIGLIYLPEKFDLSLPFVTELSNLDILRSFQILTGLLVAGFFSPAMWLNSQVKKRQKKIEYALPNALDLLQVAIEAGLGFDAAIIRVAHELHHASPAIAEEFTFLQLEIQAGKNRERALHDLAARCGVAEMSSFANVIMQSIQFGTSISDALSAYAIEMRLDRELRAQEMANKLPVKMSAVMAALMMPVLLMICLSPVLIRWMRVMTDGS